jgi:hypothetical protein
MPVNDSPLSTIPPPRVIHARMGELYRELALLRRLLRLSQAARQEQAAERHGSPTAAGQEVVCVG